VDDATHWAVLAGKISKDYVLIDSGIGQQVFSTYTRDSLLERRWYALCDNCEGTGFREGTICDACLGSCYERYGIVIDPGNHLSRHLQSNARTIIEALMGNHLLQEYWGYYLDDLTDVFDAHHGAGSAPASDFFENHEEDILEAVSYWLIGVTKPEVRRELKHYRAVAESYPLYYRSAETARVLAHFQAAFMGMLIEDYL